VRELVGDDSGSERSYGYGYGYGYSSGLVSSLRFDQAGSEVDWGSKLQHPSCVPIYEKTMVQSRQAGKHGIV
jgi:hypothetical protein